MRVFITLSSFLPLTFAISACSVFGCTLFIPFMEYPKLYINALKASIFSMSGSSCTRYIKGTLSQYMCSATVWLHTSMNSSIILSAVLLSTLTMSVGFPFSSSITLNSSNSKSMLPLSVRLAASILYSSSMALKSSKRYRYLSIREGSFFSRISETSV